MMSKTLIDMSWDEFYDACIYLATQIRNRGKTYSNYYSIPRGGRAIGVVLGHQLDLYEVEKAAIVPETLIIDDISDNGETLHHLLRTVHPHKRPDVACLYTTPWTTYVPTYYAKTKRVKNEWILFPWETIDTTEDTA